MGIIEDYYKRLEIINDIRTESIKYDSSDELLDYVEIMSKQKLIDSKDKKITKESFNEAVSRTNALTHPEKLPTDQTKIYIRCEIRKLLKAIVESNMEVHKAYIDCVSQEFSNDAKSNLMGVQKEKAFMMYGYREGDMINLLGININPESRTQKAHINEDKSAETIQDIQKNPEINVEGRTPVLVIGNSHTYTPQFGGQFANSWHFGEFRSFHKDHAIFDGVAKDHCPDLEILDLNITPSLNFNFLGYSKEDKMFYKIPDVSMVRGKEEKITKLSSYNVNDKVTFPNDYKFKLSKFIVKPSLKDLREEKKHNKQIEELKKQIEM